MQIGSFFMINLCLVVIATQFSETKKREMERMRLERARYHSTSTLASSTNTSEPTTCYAEIVKWVLVVVVLSRTLFADCVHIPRASSFVRDTVYIRELSFIADGATSLFSDTSLTFGDVVNEEWWRGIASICTNDNRSVNRIYSRNSRVRPFVQTPLRLDRIEYRAVSIFCFRDIRYNAAVLETEFEEEWVSAVWKNWY